VAVAAASEEVVCLLEETLIVATVENRTLMIAADAWHWMATSSLDNVNR